MLDWEREVYRAQMEFLLGSASLLSFFGGASWLSAGLLRNLTYNS